MQKYMFCELLCSLTICHIMGRLLRVLAYRFNCCILFHYLFNHFLDRYTLRMISYFHSYRLHSNGGALLIASLAHYYQPHFPDEKTERLNNFKCLDNLFKNMQLENEPSKMHFSGKNALKWNCWVEGSAYDNGDCQTALPNDFEFPSIHSSLTWHLEPVIKPD